MLKLLRFLTGATLVLLSFSVKAQHHNVKFEHLTSSDGLANVGINHVFQDSKGFIWFGTSGGLHQYDGYKMKVFRHSTHDTTSLSDNNVTFICEDAHGALWIGTRNGLNRYSNASHTFTRFKNAFGRVDLLQDKSIRYIREDNEHKLWVAVSGSGLLIFNPHTEKFEKLYSVNGNSLKDLSSNFVKAITSIDQHNLWIGSDNGLMFYNKEEDTFTKYVPDPGQPSLPNAFIKTLCPDKHGNLWIGTDGGLAYATIKDNQIVSWKNYIYQPGNQHGISNNFIKHVMEDKAGQVWIASDNGINVYDPASDVFTHYSHHQRNETSLINKYCRTLIEDRQGIIWIGTEGGISKYDKERFLFKSYTHVPSNSNSLASAFVTAVLEDKKGFLWIGTNDGLNRFDRNAGTYEVYSTTTKTASLVNNHITALAEDQEGDLWVGTNEGVSKINRLRNKVTHYTIPNSSYTASDAILSLHHDRHNNIYVGTYTGIKKYNREKDVLENFLPEKVDGRIQVIYRDNDDVLWIGTRTELYRIQETGSIKSFRHSDNNPASISYNYITSIWENDNKGLWIGTTSGLNYFNKETEAFSIYTWDHGFPSDFITGIVGDQDKTLWITTDNGLVHFDPKGNSIHTYYEKDGLQSNSFNFGAIYKSSSGELFLGSVNGLNSFYPEELTINTYLAPVYINNFQLFNKTITPGKHSALHTSITELNELRLTHEEKVITFEFVALNYRNSLKNQYAYKMEGFDNDWNFTDSERRFATYTNLEPGTYTFHVKASNNDNIWNEKGTQLTIIITPPFWKTWWFYTLVTVVGTSLFFLILWLRIRNLRKAKQNLTLEVSRRTIELHKEKERLELANRKITDQIDEIEAQKELLEEERKHLQDAQITIKKQNEQLHAVNVSLEEKVNERTQELNDTIEKMVLANDELDFFVYRTAHDLRGPIARMEGLCHVAQLEPEPLEAFKYLRKVEQVSREMNSMLSRLLRTRTLNKKEVRLHPINLAGAVRKSIDCLHVTENTKGIKIINDVPADQFINCDIELLDILLENVITNSIRFRSTDKSSFIKITAYTEANENVIVIEDNGIGIPPDLAEKVFDMFFIGTDQSGGFGLGLYEAKVIMRKLHGIIKFVARERELTTLLIRLPQ